MQTEITIRQFVDDDAPQVRELFIVANRLLSPPDLIDAFEGYIKRALAEEIDRITDYYGQRDGGFWVAIKDGTLVGTFGLERVSPQAMELRRMYVAPDARRRGIANRDMARQVCRGACRADAVIPGTANGSGRSESAVFLRRLP